MPPPRRTAFDVSFPDEVQPHEIGQTRLTTAEIDLERNRQRAAAQQEERAQRQGGASASTSRVTSQAASTPQPRPDEPEQPVPKYIPRRGERPEVSIMMFEDDGRRDRRGNRTKPLRCATEFVIYDLSRDGEMVSLEVLEQIGQPALAGRLLRLAAKVIPIIENPEDAAIDEDSGQGDDGAELLVIQNIENVAFDYSVFNSPLYVESNLATYILNMPAKSYHAMFLAAFRPRKVAQIAVSSLCVSRHQEYEVFLHDLRTFKDPLVSGLRESDLKDAWPLIQSVVNEVDRSLTRTTVLTKLKQKCQEDAQRPLPPINFGRIRAEERFGPAQQQTCVTRRIYNLTHSYVNEQLYVTGPAKLPKDLPRATLKRVWQKNHKLYQQELDQFIKGENVPRKRVVVSGREDYFGPRGRYARFITIQGRKYSTGRMSRDEFYQPMDLLVIPRNDLQDEFRPSSLKTVAPGQHAGHFFRFARLISIHRNDQRLHVQWVKHACQTALGEIHDQRELFLTKMCGDIAFNEVVGSTKCRFLRSREDTPNEDQSEYYSRFIYAPCDGSFRDLEHADLEAFAAKEPPENCPVCPVKAHKAEAQEPHLVPGGFAWHGSEYHLHDFVFIKTSEGVSYLGQIKEFAERRQASDVEVCLLLLFGVDGLMPGFDERRYFVSGLRDWISATCIIGVAHVLDEGEFNALGSIHRLPTNVVYAAYKIKPTAPQSMTFEWEQRRDLAPGEFPRHRCDKCYQKMMDELRATEEYVQGISIGRPLQVFDPFGGVGAFAMGVADAAHMKLTHAVEIDPDAAMTLGKNSPHTIVYNACSNRVFDYSVRSWQKRETRGPPIKVVFPIEDGPVPPVPKNSVDVLVAGFPCQPHSTLNQYRQADDRKSNLILNLLSWVDFLQPRFCYFENVRGFLSYKLDTVQAGPRAVEGGIELGGLKLLLRVLTALKYQVRYSLLQAGQYGTPQSRIRFFLIAARTGESLPQFPRPTHAFPVKEELRIHLPSGDVQFEGACEGVAPFQPVTIQMAIEDLPEFHWETPGKKRRREDEEEEEHIKSIRCDEQNKTCGLPGAPAYAHFPATSLQMRARERADWVRELQQYTRTFSARVVERVLAIEMKARADYRALPLALQEWQSAAPNSARARDGFRPGMYGRLGENDFFYTTVTNVSPTAKQSWVLHPWLKRIYTVRELARSQTFPDNFQFYTVRNGESHDGVDKIDYEDEIDVVSIHRQIGNAVPFALAEALGRELLKVLVRKWHDREIMEID